jgi:hypothetical protein
MMSSTSCLPRAARPNCRNPRPSDQPKADWPRSRVGRNGAASGRRADAHTPAACARPASTTSSRATHHCCIVAVGAMIDGSCFGSSRAGRRSVAVRPECRWQGSGFVNAALCVCPAPCSSRTVACQATRAYAWGEGPRPGDFGRVSPRVCRSSRTRALAWCGGGRAVTDEFEVER